MSLVQFVRPLSALVLVSVFILGACSEVDSDDDDGEEEWRRSHTFTAEGEVYDFVDLVVEDGRIRFY